MKTMWQIIGSGAIGCLWAANLLKSGQQVHLVRRKKKTLQTLTYQDLSGHRVSLPCSHSTQLTDSISPILVCVKAPQVTQALLAQRANIAVNQVIILMHNGMGTAEQVAEIFPKNPIICATTANACLLKSPSDIQQTGLGISYLGPFNAQAKSYAHLATSLNKALDNTHWHDSIEQKLWLKLLINIAINPLTAIFQIKNGVLAEQDYQLKIEKIINEVMPVLGVMGLAFNQDELLSTINGVINATAENYSSMNRDIHFKRHTENEYISGYLLKKASQHHIETPFIQSLYEKITVLDNR
ncbi:ketopantoate reductase family protein [Psychromonas sp. Urea-02u-13]|uniref:ketopantoate reductase family protein n=1 Tax=Psychromonas sp. Urea-02u-13 TaxID=2058326 RepID=UPI001E28E1B3|nr:2-dehydropantoate 2-reductase [Psychromonas sp. Urea-02u-13]